VGQGGVISEIVDAYDVNIWIGECGAKEVAANTSKTINSDINHVKPLLHSEMPQITVAIFNATTLGA
jgi:hypothetical protein